MNIIWTNGALDDFTEIATWYHNDRSSKAAEKFMDNVLHCIELLSQNPFMGRQEEFSNKNLSGYRSLVIHPYYKIVYQINSDKNHIDIFAIWDCRQDDKNLIKTLQR